jgi:type II secretory pathway component PulJ
VRTESGFLLMEAIFTLAMTSIGAVALWSLVRSATALSLRLEVAAQTDQGELRCRAQARFYECAQGDKLIIILK